jgi:hypothetical protein
MRLLQGSAVFCLKKKNFFGVADLDFLDFFAFFAVGAFFARLDRALASGTKLNAKTATSKDTSKRRINFAPEE